MGTGRHNEPKGACAEPRNLINSAARMEALRKLDDLLVRDEYDGTWSVFCDRPMFDYNWLSLLEGIELKSLRLKTGDITERALKSYLPKVRSVRLLNVAVNRGLAGVFLMSLPDDFHMQAIDVCKTSMRGVALQQLVRLKNLQRVYANRGQFSEAALSAVPPGRGLEIQYLD